MKKGKITEHYPGIFYEAKPMDMREEIEKILGSFLYKIDDINMDVELENIMNGAPSRRNQAKEECVNRLMALIKN